MKKVIWVSEDTIYGLDMTGPWGREADIPEDKVKWIESVAEQYKKVQAYLNLLYECKYPEDHKLYIMLGQRCPCWRK